MLTERKKDPASAIRFPAIARRTQPVAVCPPAYDLETDAGRNAAVEPEVLPVAEHVRPKRNIANFEHRYPLPARPDALLTLTNNLHLAVAIPLEHLGPSFIPLE